MATTLQNLGQIKPNAGVWTVLLIVDAGIGVVCSNFAAYNQSASPDTIGVRLRVHGVAALAKHQRESMVVPGSDTQPLTLFTASAGDVLEVYSLNGTTVFSADGSETNQ